MTRGFVAYELPTSAPPTDDSESSSSPGLPTPRATRGGSATETVELLRTPTAQLAVNGGSQHPDKRKAGGHGPTLADEIEHLLPTPTAMDSRMSGGSGASDVTLTDAMVRGKLLPTPRARDGKGRDPNPRGVDLNEAVALIPTPLSSDAGPLGGTKGYGLRDWSRAISRGESTSPPSDGGNEPSDG